MSVSGVGVGIAVPPSAPLSSLFTEWMSRAETEQFLQQTLDTIQQLDKTVLQHQIVRETTNQQIQEQAHQTFAEAAAAVHMDDIQTHAVHMPQSLPSSTTISSTISPNTHGRTLSPTFINITPPSGSGGSSSSPLASPNPKSPLGPRSPGANGRVLLSLSPNPHPLDPSHLQVDEVSLRASPTSSARRITPIDALIVSHSPSSSPSPPGSPLASPNSVKKRLNKPLNLPSSPRLTSPSPPRSPARHIASPLPQARSPQSIRPFYYPDGIPTSPRTKKRELDLIEQLWRQKQNGTDPLEIAKMPFAIAPSQSSSPSSTVPGGAGAAGQGGLGQGQGQQDKSLSEGVNLEELFPITTLACGFSSYCNSALFEKLLQLQNDARLKKGLGPTPNDPAQGIFPRIQLDTFLQFHAREIERFDLPTRFYRLLRSQDPQTGQPRKYLTRDDFKPIVQEIVNRHPGLEFLESTPEFQLKYAQTVIARIFYAVNQSGNEQLTIRELRDSNFLLMLALLDQEDDINKLNDFFSYEHFYVVYCKFWELDEDHDGYIDANDLIQYDDYALTHKVVERIMTGAGRKFLSPIPNKMSYLDFVVFLISEVDKNSDVSLNYWFNIIDLDGDGIISTYEIEYFFEEQKHRIQSLSQELITFPDIMCQLIDMVQKPLTLLYGNGGASGLNNTQNDSSSKRASGGANSPFLLGPSSSTSFMPSGEPRLKEKKMSYGGGASSSGGSGSGSHSPFFSHSSSGGMFPSNTSFGISSSSSSAAFNTGSSQQQMFPSSTLQPALFHSHHKPFHSTATHTPVQGGAIYNVSEGLFYRKDLKESRMASQFFATLFNLNKFVLSEQRDPIRIKQIHDTPQLSDWDRYAISGYYRLAELPETTDAAAAWADMSDGGPDDHIQYDHRGGGGDDGSGTHHMEVDHGNGRKDTIHK